MEKFKHLFILVSFFMAIGFSSENRDSLIEMGLNDNELTQNDLDEYTIKFNNNGTDCEVNFNTQTGNVDFNLFFDTPSTKFKIFSAKLHHAKKLNWKNLQMKISSLISDNTCLKKNLHRFENLLLSFELNVSKFQEGFINSITNCNCRSSGSRSNASTFACLEFGGDPRACVAIFICVGVIILFGFVFVWDLSTILYFVKISPFLLSSYWSRYYVSGPAVQIFAALLNTMFRLKNFHRVNIKPSSKKPVIEHTGLNNQILELSNFEISPEFSDLEGGIVNFLNNTGTDSASTKILIIFAWDFLMMFLFIVLWQRFYAHCDFEYNEDGEFEGSKFLFCKMAWCFWKWGEMFQLN